MHRNFLLYLTRHTPRTLVAEVDFASAVRGLLLDEERQAANLTPGYVRLVTNLGVFEVAHDTRELVLTSLHQGVSLAEVQANTGFPLKVASDLQMTVPPTPEELRVLRNEVDPLGIRRLEFITGADRASLIEELLEAEAHFIEDLAVD
jgi:glutaconate CoA-transferase, subunit A